MKTSRATEHSPTPGERLDITGIMRRVTFAGCLAMLFLHLTKGAHQAAFFRDLGARPFHFGVLGAVPPLMFSTQFISALLVNRLRYRKRFWITLLVTRRTIVCLLGLLPWLFPHSDALVLVWAFVGITIVGQAMATVSQPIFFSWMGDLLPRDSFSELWAGRQKWLNVARAGTMLFLAATMWILRDVDIRITFPILAGIGCVAGVIDILLFIKVPEPPPPLSDRPHLERLLEPFRGLRFRRYIAYDSLLRFGTLMAAAQFRVFLLQEIGLGVYAIVLLFTCHAIGGALFAKRIGRLADRVGHRPVIILGSAFKSAIVLAVFVVQPGPMLLMLVPVLLFDNMCNTALQVSRTGFVLKQATPENRPMFVAAVMASAGIAGAMGSFTGGVMMDHLPAPHFTLGFFTLTRFRIVFLVSAAIRLSAFFLSMRLHEPESVSAPEVFDGVIRPAVQRHLSTTLELLRSPWAWLASNRNEE